MAESRCQRGGKPTEDAAPYALGGMVAGMLLMGLIVWFVMPSVMVVKHRSSQSYDKTVAALSKAITSKKDWRVLTVNDFRRARQPSERSSGSAASTSAIPGMR